ncbi:MAG: hypothetical protein ACN6QE_03985 [Pseudomonas putida]
MNTSTSTSVLTPVVLRPSLPPPSGDPSKRLAEQHRAKIRKIRHDTELEAAEYAQILQKKLIARALDPNVDIDTLARITWKLSERGIGRVRDAESDEPAKQKGTAGDLLDFLTAISSVNKATLGHTPAPAIEHDITPKQAQPLDIDLEQFNE